MIASSEMMRAAWDAHQRENRPDITALSDSTHTARIPHVCDHCRDTIHAGQRYHRTVLVVDGDLSVEKLHADDADCRPRYY